MLNNHIAFKKASIVFFSLMILNGLVVECYASGRKITTLLKALESYVALHV